MSRKAIVILAMSILFILVWIISKDKVSEIYVVTPYWLEKYPVTEVWKLEDTNEYVVFHRLIRRPGVIQSFILPYDATITEINLAGSSSVEVGEKNPCMLIYNKEILKKSNSREFRWFIDKRIYAIRLIGLIVIILIGVIAYKFWASEEVA